MQWSLYQIWNQSLEAGIIKLPEIRNTIWASELGGAFIDRFLKMKGQVPSNPPNPRSKRKFEAGNIWEAIIGYVLSRAGILINKQEYLSFKYPELLQVNGKLDYIAGGKPDYQKATSVINEEFNWLPSFISRATLAIVNHLNTDFPQGLNEIIFEIKSCSNYMFEKYEKYNDAQLPHKLQLFHYLKSKNMKEGHIVYICKDDARLFEIGIFNPSPIEEEYKKDITLMTNYVINNTLPNIEEPIIYDEREEKFTTNYKIAYSSYLTFLYNFKSQAEYEGIYKPIVERWNRVVERIKDKKELTENNLNALEEMKKHNFGDIHKKIKCSTQQQI